MYKLARSLPRLVLAAILAAPFLVSGCAVHARVYDPYYHDHHVWSGEVVYYNQWENETHRHHEEFNKRTPDEQKEYWQWRHRRGDQH